MNSEFIINGKKRTIDLQKSLNTSYGKEETLSNDITDMTYNQSWYKQGFFITEFLNKNEFSDVSSGVENCVKKITESFDIDSDNFELIKYHKFVNEALHQKIVSKTRDLFPGDFNFDVKKIIEKLETILGFELTDIDPFTNKQTHIIVRINRPKSDDYNPPHKDIYELFDQEKIIQKMVNFWMPICGVTKNSMLPIVPGSHLIAESKILRTFEGGIMNQKNYRVRSVVKWNNDNHMECPKIKNGQMLIFSPHLIHGCAINNQIDATRVALEFRLHKKF